jgi:hypothetical protein
MIDRVPFWTFNIGPLVLILHKLPYNRMVGGPNGQGRGIRTN